METGPFKGGDRVPTPDADPAYLHHHQPVGGGKYRMGTEHAGSRFPANDLHKILFLDGEGDEKRWFRLYEGLSVSAKEK